MSLEDRIKELVLANDLDYIGITSAGLLADEPAGHRPSDYLPDAESVVSLGIHLHLGTQVANKLAYLRNRPSICTYLWHGFGLPNMHYLDRVAFLVTRLLEKEGNIAVPMISASPVDLRGSITEFSNIHAAVAAGLADLGWNGFALTPDFGPRVRFVSVITSAKLKPTSSQLVTRTCDPEKCKETGDGVPACVKACPVKALSAEGQTVTIAGKDYEVGKLDNNLCIWASMGYTTRAIGHRDIPMPPKIEMSDLVKAIDLRDPLHQREMLVIGRGDYCGRCIMECPAGSRKVLTSQL